MVNQHLSQVGSGLVRRFKTRDPFEIAKALGIEVLFCEGLGTLKGMYRVIKRNRFIFINADLDEQMQKIVCAHELGHDQLHRHLAKGDTLREFTLYDMRSKPEYEANVVSADILLDDNRILEYIYHYRYSAEEIAQCMGTDINLVSLKAAELMRRGHHLANVNYQSDFLRDRRIH